MADPALAGAGRVELGGRVDGDEVLARVRVARERAQERQEACFRQSDEAVRSGDPTRALARTTEAAINRAVVQALDDILGDPPS